MSLESLLGRDQRVEVTVWPDDDADRIVFETAVLECAGNKFLVGLPKKADKKFWLAVTPGTIVGVVVPRAHLPQYANEKPMILYPVVDTLWRDEEAPQQGIWLQLVSDRQPKNQQRREFVRVEIGAPIHIEWVDADSGHDKTVPGITLDVSGGGIKFVSRWGFAAGHDVTVHLHFDDETEPLPMRLKTTVVYSRPNPRPKPDGHDAYITAGSFEHLPDRDEARIMRECFRRQLGLSEKE